MSSAAGEPLSAPAWRPTSRDPGGPPPLRQYRLRDGDTVENVAERFLGSAARAKEIFEANREVLSRPDLLPVGKTIVLPPKLAADELTPVQRQQ